MTDYSKKDPNKIVEFSLPNAGKVVWNAGMTLMKIFIPAGSGWEAYQIAEQAHPGMGFYFGVGVPILEIAGYLWFKNGHKDTIVEVEKENYLSTILQKEVVGYSAFENKIGQVNEEGSLAWLVDQTAANYASARTDYTTKLDQALLVDGYMSLLEQAAINDLELPEIRSSFPVLADGPSKQLFPMSFLTFYDVTNREFDLESQVTEYVQKIRGDAEPSAEIKQYAHKIWAFSEALNGRNEPLKQMLSQ